MKKNHRENASPVLFLENARLMLLNPTMVVSELLCQIDIINLDKSPSGGQLNESFAGTQG